MKQKIARWLREIKHEPPKTPGEKPHVIQHLFKVDPPMEWTEYVAYRHGKLVHDPRRGMPNRTRVIHKRMEASRAAGRSVTYSDFYMSKPRYQYGNRTHRTSFVLASASDLKTFMEASRIRMLDVMIAKGDKEGEALFRRERDHEFEVETYLFPTDKWGGWKSGGELPGSQRGTLDHRVPFADVGYKVIGMPRELQLVRKTITMKAVIK